MPVIIEPRLLGLFFIFFFVACAAQPVKRPHSVPLVDHAQDMKQNASGKSVYDLLKARVRTVARQYDGKPHKIGHDPDKSKYSDCSHLVCAVTRNCLRSSDYRFRPYYLPSEAIRENSHSIPRQEIREGDLIYFQKTKLWGKGTHVAIVSKVSSDKLLFYHASTKQGVVETATDSDSWKYYWEERVHSYRRWDAAVFEKN